jgi:hypothetical protein
MRYQPKTPVALYSPGRFLVLISVSGHIVVASIRSCRMSSQYQVGTSMEANSHGLILGFTRTVRSIAKKSHDIRLLGRGLKPSLSRYWTGIPATWMRRSLYHITSRTYLPKDSLLYHILCSSSTILHPAIVPTQSFCHVVHFPSTRRFDCSSLLFH